MSVIPPAFEDTGHDGAPFDFPRPPLEQSFDDAAGGQNDPAGALDLFPFNHAQEIARG